MKLTLAASVCILTIFCVSAYPVPPMNSKVVLIHNRNFMKIPSTTPKPKKIMDFTAIGNFASVINSNALATQNKVKKADAKAKRTATGLQMFCLVNPNGTYFVQRYYFKVKKFFVNSTETLAMN